MKFLKSIELQYDELKALSLCKAKQDVRFYLCGIYIGDGLMASTNGHIALVVDSPETSGMDLIIPAETIDSLVKKVGNNPMIKTVDLHQLEDGFWLFDHNGSYELFKPIEGKFPNIKRIDIKKPEKITFTDYPIFDINYLATFLKAGKVFGMKTSPVVYPTAEKECAYVELTDRTHGLLMPRRF